MRRKVSFKLASFAVDKEARSLTGVLLPFGEVSGPAADPTTGATARFSFAEGTVMLPDDPMDVVLNYGHDGKSLYMQVGVASVLATDSEGVHAKFNIARTPEGDRVLALADAGVLKSFSAEVEGDFTPDKAGVQHATAAILTGAAVVPKPAFKGAHITSVAASAVDDNERNTAMKCTKCGAVHANEIACDPAVAAAFSAAATFSKADADKLIANVQAVSERLAKLEEIKIPVGPGAAQFQVTEEPIYRFAGSEGAASGFDFATDLLAAGKDGDAAALARIQKFTADRQAAAIQFADQPTTTADVAAVNPSQYRPDMFLGQAPTPTSPLYDTFVKGSLTNVTPFFWSKLDRTNTDVGVADHTEDVNPESRDLVTAAGATVTPVPVSGRVHITREVADQGGNPVVSALIWAEYERSFAIARETKTAALVNAATVTELGGTITAGSTDGKAAGAIVKAGLVGLQFIPDGYRFTTAFGHVDLYKLLTTAETTGGEPLYPILNPTNRDGSSTAKYSSMDIAGYNMYPAASLGATNVNQKSYVVDPNAVHVWASGLTRLDKLSETVAGWDMSVFGYFAGVVYDVTGLRKITFDVTA